VFQRVHVACLSTRVVVVFRHYMSCAHVGWWAVHNYSLCIGWGLAAAPGLPTTGQPLLEPVQAAVAIVAFHDGRVPLSIVC
jgi:hypothetical protein